jgi:hypothetical protein
MEHRVSTETLYRSENIVTFQLTTYFLRRILKSRKLPWDFCYVIFIC